MQMKDVQKEILENKKRHGFNTTDIEQEFCRLYGEVGEAYDAYYKGTDNFAEELADVAIFFMGIAEIEGIDLEAEILKKVEKIKRENMCAMKKEIWFMCEQKEFGFGRALFVLKIIEL